jgi:hypothetical protein
VIVPSLRRSPDLVEASASERMGESPAAQRSEQPGTQGRRPVLVPRASGSVERTWMAGDER